MASRPTADEGLDWTIGEAGFPETAESLPEGWPLAAEPPPAPPAVISVRSWLVTIGAVLGVMAAGWLGAAWSDLARAVELRGVVAAEEQAALARDAETVRALSDPAGGVWLAQRLERVAAGQPAPHPLNFLRATGAAGAVIRLAELTPGLMRVDVTRVFTDPAGRAFTFALPQFYQRATAGGWRRVPPPESFWGEAVRVAGARVELVAPAVDEDWARESLPALDALLERFCAEVACPDSPITVTFGHNSYLRPEAPLLHPDDPLLIGLLPAVVSRNPHTHLLWLSPHDIGYPVDAAGRDLLGRSLATQVLFAAADRAAFGPPNLMLVGNVYFFALVARLGERYGLETGTAALDTGRPLVEAVTDETLWDFRFGAAWRRPDLIRYALGQLNLWLAGQPPETDLKLLAASASAPSLAAWLAAADLAAP